MSPARVLYEMKKVIYIIIGVTILWYLFLFISMGKLVAPCICPEITEDTYLGPSWPILLPEVSCGDCGVEIPTPPSVFFGELLIISFPGILILLGYGAYRIVINIKRRK